MSIRMVRVTRKPAANGATLDVSMRTLSLLRAALAATTLLCALPGAHARQVLGIESCHDRAVHKKGALR